MPRLSLLFILIILSSVIANCIKETYSDFNYNEDKAIPVPDGEFNLNANLYLTENSDTWFTNILQPLEIEPLDIPRGVPLEVKSLDFAVKMGDMVGTYMINLFNSKLGSDELVAQYAGEASMKYVVVSYDVMEIIYYYQTSPFSDIYPQFYTADNTKITGEISTTDKNMDGVCEVWAKYAVARETKAWGVLIDVKTRHYRGDTTPQILSFSVEGKIFEDKLSNISRNISPYMTGYSCKMK